MLHSRHTSEKCNIDVELNRYAELLYKRLAEEFYPARQLSFLA